MKLTRKAFMEKSAEVSAKRAMDFENVVEEKGASSSAKIFPTIMVLIGGMTMRSLANRLGLTDEDTEVDVTKAMFDDAIATVMKESASAENSSLVISLETTMFCFAMSEALFGKENDDDSEKADS